MDDERCQGAGFGMGGAKGRRGHAVALKEKVGRGDGQIQRKEGMITGDIRQRCRTGDNGVAGGGKALPIITLAGPENQVIDFPTGKPFLDKDTVIVAERAGHDEEDMGIEMAEHGGDVYIEMELGAAAWFVKRKQQEGGFGHSGDAGRGK